jgi:hypothetical protein
MHRLVENEMNAKNLKTDDKILFRDIYQINQPRLFLKFAIGHDGNYTNEALP